jgi:hypothetical protein
MKLKSLQPILLGAALALPAFAFAVSLPATKTQGDITYLSGGAGHDEAQAIQQAEKEWPLALEFAIKAKPHNEFTSNVKVMIQDEKGKTVLDTMSDGPFVLVKLTPGKYVVTAERSGHTIERHVTVTSHGHRRQVFIWAS